MNVLTERAISVDDDTRLSLPALLAAMARDEIRQFPAMRPHQRPAWHMFLVQLAAFAVWTSKCSTVPTNESDWSHLLRMLTPDVPDDAAWRLVLDDREIPAFLQPPDPGGLKWTVVPTPDDLDILITSRNHDIKQSIARQSSAEDWLFALVSLQTSAGYDGKGNYGIARMNGGSSSRPMLGFAPASRRDHRINPSRWWLRDVQQLLAQRKSGLGDTHGRDGGSALLWCLDWREGSQLDLRTLDPWFIDVSRRVRLRKTDNGLSCIRANSKRSRIASKLFKGCVGDPWAPVHRTERKSLTLGSGDFNYKRLSDLMFSGDWERPMLAKLGHGEDGDDWLLIAEAFSRGNSKTEGFRSRVLPVPSSAVRMFQSPAVADLSQQLMFEIREFDEALRNGIAVLAAGGERERVDKTHYGHSHAVRNRFDRVADALFFPHLWQRLSAQSEESSEAVDEAKHDFLQQLFEAAQSELKAALLGIPCAAINRPKAEARCWRAFHGRLYKLLEFSHMTQADQVDTHG